MASNTDERAVEYRNRLTHLEEEKRQLSEDIREISKEMKSSGLSKEEIAGIKLAVRRYFETDAKRMSRETAEEFAASLGQLIGTPLGEAAR